jgi:hypothetical protein
VVFFGPVVNAPLVSKFHVSLYASGAVFSAVIAAAQLLRAACT